MDLPDITRTDSRTQGSVYAVLHRGTGSLQIVPKPQKLRQSRGTPLCARHLVYPALRVIHRFQQTGGESSDLRFKGSATSLRRL